jgi:hypothetical protein
MAVALNAVAIGRGRIRFLRKQFIIPGLAAIIILAALIHGYPRLAKFNFLLCEYECGATLLAEFEARNVRLFGLRYVTNC